MGGWEIRKEDLTATGWFRANLLGEIADGHVDGVRTLVAYECELRLVG